MTGRIVEAGLWLTALAAAAAAYGGWRGTPASPHAPVPSIPAVGLPHTVRATVLEQAADSVYEKDPFRLERQPSGVVYGAHAEAEMAPQPTEPVPPKPLLVLKGIVGGPPWAAVVQGIPGREGNVVVQRGDTLGGLRIRGVGHDSVIISGADTTWKLVVTRSWQ